MGSKDSRGNTGFADEFSPPPTIILPDPHRAVNYALMSEIRGCICSDNWLEDSQTRQWARDGEEVHAPPAPFGSAQFQGMRGTVEQDNQTLVELYNQYREVASRIRAIEYHRAQFVFLTAPIRRLPVEILVMIIGDRCFAQHFGDTKKMIKIRLVCRRWNAVVVNTPQLWSRMKIEVCRGQRLWPKTWMTTWVSNSKGALLDVDIDIYPSFPTEEVISLLQPLLRTVHRWRTLQVAGGAKFARIINPFVITDSITDLQIHDPYYGVTDYSFIIRVADYTFDYSKTRRKKAFANLRILRIGRLDWKFLPRFEAGRLDTLVLSEDFALRNYATLTASIPSLRSVTFDRSIIHNMSEETDIEDIRLSHTRLSSLTLKG